MNNYAYITLLSTNNYIYGCIGLMYSWRNTNPQYPFYVIVTPDITEENIEILKGIGYKVIKDELFIPKSYYETLKKIENGELNIPLGFSTADLSKNGWQYGWTKLQIFKYVQFDKLLYIDADTYVAQNLDYIFEKPLYSGVPEWNAYFYGNYRFLSAFMLIKPDIQLYNGLIKFAEEHPILIHPQTNRPQLSNDYDLLNMFFGFWQTSKDLHLPQYTYVDSMWFEIKNDFGKYWLNNFYKIKAIHLSSKKPWLGGKSFVYDNNEVSNIWKELYLLYIDFLNECLTDIHYRGIADIPLIN